MLWETDIFAKTIGTTARVLERKRKNKKTLSFEISENAIEMARISTFSVEYFESVKR
jgi:uncharacterized protein (DUF2384 family)